MEMQPFLRDAADKLTVAGNELAMARLGLDSHNLERTRLQLLDVQRDLSGLAKRLNQVATLHPSQWEQLLTSLGPQPGAGRG